MLNTFCDMIDANKYVQTRCNNKRRCTLQMNSNTFVNLCKSVSKYLQVKYECIPRPVMKNPCYDSPCGFGALCTSVKGSAVCSCPVGATGNPEERCCKQLKCG